jgi:hypothetical protein
MGTFVAYRIKQLVRQQLDRQVVAGLVDARVAEQALDTRFQFIGVDSDRPEYLAELKAVPIGRVQAVNHQLQARYLHQPQFKSWWHEDWMPGGFVNGCGHVRLKGRLAYFLERELGRVNASTLIRTHVQDSVELMNELPLEEKSVSVFVCSSLSGGTGGGTFLAVLNAIKGIPSTRTYGVVIGSEIAADRSETNRKSLERANFRAGMIELDAWMNPDPTLSHAAGWQVYWPAPEPVDAVLGERPPADLIWLFDMMNNSGQRMPSQIQAINTAADAIATWIHSSTTATINQLDSDIMTTVANMTNQFNATVGRPVRYGAMGVAHLEFAADRALDYLAASFGLQVIQDHILARSGGREVLLAQVNSFCEKMQILEAAPGQDQILNQLRALLRQPMPSPQVPPRPALGNQLRTAANRNSYSTIVNAAMANLESTQNGRLTAYRKLCGDWVSEQLEGRDSVPSAGVREQLRSEVARIIGSPSGSVDNAAEFLLTLRSRIVDDEAKSLQRELEDPDGYQAERAKLDRSKAQEIKALPGLMGTEGRIRDFVATWWERWNAVNEAIIERTAALEFYQEFVLEIEAQRRALEVCRKYLADSADWLRRRESTALQPPDPGSRGGITVDVLTDNAGLLRQTFDRPDERAAEVATAFSADPRDGLVAFFNEAITHVHALSGKPQQGQRVDELRAQRELDRMGLESRFRNRLDRLARDEYVSVSQFTVWEALAAEAEERLVPRQWSDIQRYVGQRLNALVDNAAPMFPVRPERSIAVGLPTPEESTFLVANEGKAHEFAVSHNAPDPTNWLASWVSKQLGDTSKPVDTVDFQRVSLVRRIAGFPVLSAESGWDTEDQKAFVKEERNRFLWSDARASRLPRDFAAINRVEIAYLAALAISTDTVAARADGGYDFPARRQFAAGDGDLLTLLLLDAGKRRAVRAQTTESLGDATIKDWESRLTELETWLESRQASLPRASADARAVESMRDAVRVRFDDLVNIDESGQRTSVEDMLPRLAHVGESAD